MQNMQPSGSLLSHCRCALVHMLWLLGTLGIVQLVGLCIHLGRCKLRSKTGAVQPLHALALIRVQDLPIERGVCDLVLKEITSGLAGSAPRPSRCGRCTYWNGVAGPALRRPTPCGWPVRNR